MKKSMFLRLQKNLKTKKVVGCKYNRQQENFYLRLNDGTQVVFQIFDAYVVTPSDSEKEGRERVSVSI
jgi:hypothetical protein